MVKFIIPRRSTFKKSSMFGTRHRGGLLFKRSRRRGKIRLAQRGFVRTTGFFGKQRGELKFLDQDIDDAIVVTTGTIFLNSNTEASLVRIPEGNGESARIGRKLTIRSINWRFTVDVPETDGAANPANSDTIRLILYLDKQANGAAAAVTDILESASFQSFNNLANSKRFRTLMDRTYSINVNAGGGNGTTSDWAQTRIDDTFFAKVNIPIEYNNASTDGALATVRSNNIGLLAISGSGTGGLQSKMRLRYSDS